MYGDLDSSDLIKEESGKADIVCNWANADHEGAASAIIAGKPKYYIHTSGTGILLWQDISEKTWGEAREKEYNDWDGIGEVTSLPDDAPHRSVDKIVLAGADQGIKTAIVCPPTIYGPGRGPGNKRSHQVPELARCTIEQGHGIVVGEGKSYWTNVNVHDLSEVYVRLVEEATKEDNVRATWGKEGYYFTENGTHIWGDIGRAIAKEAAKQGWVESEEVKRYDGEEAGKLTPWGQALWGANSRAKAIRARELLGWTPKGHSLMEEIPGVVKMEAERLGRVTHHAQKAAGTA